MADSDLISSISTYELLPLLDANERPFLLDVREEDEVTEWSIPGVYNIPLGALEARLDEVPSGVRVVTICAMGTRAQQGAELLARHGRSS